MLTGLLRKISFGSVRQPLTKFIWKFPKAFLTSAYNSLYNSHEYKFVHMYVFMNFVHTVLNCLYYRDHSRFPWRGWSGQIYALCLSAGSLVVNNSGFKAVSAEFFLSLASKLENPLDYYIFPAPMSRRISPYRLNEDYYCTKNLAQCPAERIILKIKNHVACAEHTTPTEDFPSHEPKISTQRSTRTKA